MWSNLNKLLFYVYGCFACMYFFHVPHVGGAHGSQIPRTRVRDGCEPPCGCWDLGLGEHSSCWGIAPAPNIANFKRSPDVPKSLDYKLLWMYKGQITSFQRIILPSKLHSLFQKRKIKSKQMNKHAKAKGIPAGKRPNIAAPMASNWSLEYSVLGARELGF